MEKNREVLFEAKDICKNFGTTIALNHVDLTVYRGEIRGLIGENGSGKSTITSIAAGMQAADSGKMYLKGQEHKPATMIEGAAAGFGMIVQEMGTISGITIAQNIFLGNERAFKKHGLISVKAMNKEAKKALDAIGYYDCNPAMYIDELNMQDRKLVEIARVMYSNPEVLVVDETTTALSQQGRDIIYQLMKKMKEENKAVLFISHDLEETMEQCDSLTVLRDGQLITTLDKKDFESNLVKKHMVGREIGEHYYREDKECTYEEEVLIRAHEVTTGRGLTKNVSLELHKGEILGIGGLSHCGMHELGRALFGEEPIVTGEITYAPTGERIENARVAMRHGMGYVSKNRDAEALVLTGSIKENIVGTGFNQIEKYGIITPSAEKKYVQKQIDGLRIKCANMNQQVKFLSGGNKQKVVFGKWIGRNAEILILDCPTRGVDIGVKAAMYELMETMKKEGKAILMISEEMAELIGMCDRIIIMKDGYISGELNRSEQFDEDAVINYMI
ncbi:sugar ABC transporter ATP-binding protein [Anaerosporobacter sp.]|uniref:sugar ABC transporter ATP-binding protein n=1 Tax=Anaerosporobacter sp. TaxID=1872529 RepID=UPI00286EC48E|nr:sugar ABC transporter ATP-binding protein [Anaerosporobacter sp.]